MSRCKKQAAGRAVGGILHEKLSISDTPLYTDHVCQVQLHIHIRIPRAEPGTKLLDSGQEKKWSEKAQNELYNIWLGRRKLPPGKQYGNVLPLGAVCGWGEQLGQSWRGMNEWPRQLHQQVAAS